MARPPKYWLRACAVVFIVTWAGSTVAFAMQHQLLGAMLSVAAGLASGGVVWFWIKSNGRSP